MSLEKGICAFGFWLGAVDEDRVATGVFLMYCMYDRLYGLIWGGLR